jgi:peptidyl-prolyl cis-trans isomerase-like 2
VKLYFDSFCDLLSKLHFSIFTAVMGKNTDKLYITHSEWASEDAYSASAGAGVSRAKTAGVNSSSFKRLPYNYCSLSLQPFSHPVCTANGTIFDIEHIMPWLEKHGTNPVDGRPLKKSDLIKLNFATNDDGEYVDPVTYKVFTDNTHIVALKKSGNVFSWDTVERLNIKAKNWRDLVSDDEFTRKDIITIQDPQNIESRNLSSFKYLKEGTSTLSEKEEADRKDPLNNVNVAALGNAAKIVKAKEAVARARAEREKGLENGGIMSLEKKKALAVLKNGGAAPGSQSKALPYNAAHHSTGKAAASFTSTGVTPHTGAERATLTDEEFMLKTKRVKINGYARLQTNHGDLNVELYPEWAPKAVWNFIQLAKGGQYKDLIFHRNIRNFMIQGGDPTGTGRGGSSIWGKNFVDEIEGPLKFDSRGMLAMANKGKDTNSSQFFITYRPTKHLERKHTIFGKVVDGLDVLNRLEDVKTDDKDSPIDPIELINVVVFVDPFEEFMKQRAENETKAKEDEEVKKAGGTEDDRVTWTGKRVREDGSIAEKKVEVGKYLSAALSQTSKTPKDEADLDDEGYQPLKKKAKGGFGNFDNW